jgi:hypothetical protein
MEKSALHGSVHYAFFSILLLLPVSLVWVFSSESLPHTPSICVVPLMWKTEFLTCTKQQTKLQFCNSSEFWGRVGAILSEKHTVPIISPEDGNSTFLRSVGLCRSVYVASKPITTTTTTFSSLPPWESRILYSSVYFYSFGLRIAGVKTKQG